MNTTDEHRLADVLERFANQMETEQETTKHSVLSIEKIVAAVIMLIVTGVCLWAGSTLQTLNGTVIQLRSDMTHTVQTVTDVKVEMRELRNNANGQTAQNTTHIKLLLDKYQVMDDQMKRWYGSMQQMQDRILILEQNANLAP